MFGISKKGFSLIEVMVAMALIGLLATIIVPNLGRKSPDQERKNFIEKLNQIVRLTIVSAITKQKVHKIDCDIVKRTINVSFDTGKKNNEGKDKFDNARLSFVSLPYEWHESFDIKNFFIEGIDEVGKHGAGKKSELKLWFYVIPEGKTQRVTINFVDRNDNRTGSPQKIGLVLNPFMGQFEEYDSFQKA